MVYIDNAYKKHKNMTMCHLTADTLNELHKFAEYNLGLKRWWFQNKKYPHYDVSLVKRDLAIQHGAKEVTTKELIQIVKKAKILKENILINKFIKMFKCDTARISKLRNMFLVIGARKSTKDSKTSYYTDDKGNKIDFDYIEERVIASGKNEKELIEDAKHYKFLLSKY